MRSGWGKHLADPRRSKSIGNHLRRRRFRLFSDLLAGLEPPVKILDVGGTASFWRQMGFDSDAGAQVVVLNQEPGVGPEDADLQSVVGDARDMPEFKDDEFDVVFSNSVIEHVGDLDEQRRMADEVQRVAPRFFVQTPNRAFPIEPHFLFPGFQWLPMGLRAQLVQRFPIAYSGRISDRQAAERVVRGVRLLSHTELRSLFPAASIYRERVGGITKSFVAYGGWSDSAASATPVVATAET